MRILHVNKFLHRRGGAESYLLDLAAEQQRRGHEVSFFSMQHPENDPDPHADLFPSHMELNPPPEGIGARLRTAGQILYRPDAKAGMEAILDEVRPDVVHLHNIYHQLSPSVLRPLAKRSIPAVMTLHDYKLACPTYQFLDADGQICEACISGKLREATKRRCNQGSLAGSLLASVEVRMHRTTDAYGPVNSFICPSRFLRDKMVEADVYPDRLVHLPNFCDIDGITPAEHPGNGVVYAGRLSPEKGVDTLIDAAALMPAYVPVTIAGDGPERERLERRAHERGVADQVRFVGRLPVDELHQLIRSSAVMAAPSRWYENQPMTILEAYGCGRPVVASRLGGLPELIDDWRTGSLVNHDDPRALALALERWALDPLGSHEAGRMARKLALTTYSLDAHVEGLEDIYRDAKSKRGAA